MKILKIKCPDMRTPYEDTAICNVSGKPCLLEEGLRCPDYEQYLKEEGEPES